MLFNKILSNFEAKMKKHLQYISIFSIAAISIIMVACASIGRPEGGPRDEMPPVYISSTPKPGATNVSKPKIEILFDENINIKDASTKVVVSPAQKAQPSIFASGKKVIVELRDSIIPNATYTIDFADAICDLNEGNPIDGFAIDFSTSDSIDSLRISGMLFEARTLEPAQGMLVGVYSNLADSAISTLPLERISKTNQLGQFTIRGLKPGKYHLFALNDKNRDYHWDRSEDIAFYDVEISPSVTSIEVTDTLRAVNGTDSLVTRQGVKYLPNDILLTWFNEGYAAQYLKDYKRPERKKITLEFAAKADTLPQITIINGENAGMNIDEWAVLNTGETLDTLEYWIKNPQILAQDSILVSARYLRTDTNDQLSWTTDTLKLIFKDRKTKKKKKKKDEEEDTVPQINFINWMVLASNPQDINRPLRFQSSQPIESIDNSKIHLSILRDTVWEEVSHSPIVPDSAHRILSFTMPMQWEPGMKYKLEIDSAAIVGIYNEWNKKIAQEFNVRATEDYANLFFEISPSDNPIVVELLDASDKVVSSAPVVDGYANFYYILPGTYYARAFIDLNKNGKYDSGNLSQKVQPEEIFYYNKRIAAKKNWDIEQSWNIFELPIDTQKPLEIKKNKPAQKRTDKDQNEKEEEEYDEFDDEYYDINRQNGSNNQYNPSNISRPGLRQHH